MNQTIPKLLLAHFYYLWKDTILKSSDHHLILWLFQHQALCLPLHLYSHHCLGDIKIQMDEPTSSQTSSSCNFSCPTSFSSSPPWLSLLWPYPGLVFNNNTCSQSPSLSYLTYSEYALQQFSDHMETSSSSLSCSSHTPSSLLKYVAPSRTKCLYLGIDRVILAHQRQIG